MIAAKLDRGVGVLLVGLLGLAADAQAAEPPRSRTRSSDDFLVGTALGTRQIMGEEPQALELAARSSSTRSRRRTASSGPRSIPSRTSTTSSRPTSTSSGAKSTACSSSATRCVAQPDAGLGVRGRRRQAARSRDGARTASRSTSTRSSAATRAASTAGTSSTKRSTTKGKLRTGPVGTLAQARRAVARGDRRRLHRAGVPLRPRRRPRRRAVLQRLQRVVSGEDRGDLEAGHATQGEGRPHRRPRPAGPLGHGLSRSSRKSTTCSPSTASSA